MASRVQMMLVGTVGVVFAVVGFYLVSYLTTLSIQSSNIVLSRAFLQLR
jgi:hypothetical protein